MSNQQVVTLIKELAERETGNLHYRPASAARPVLRRRLALLAVGTCATVAAAVVAVVAFTGSGPSALAPGYAGASPSEPSWFAPSVDYGPSEPVPTGAPVSTGPRIQALADQVRAQFRVLDAPVYGFQTPDLVRVRWNLGSGGTLVALQEQATRPLSTNALLEGYPSTAPRPLPYQLADGVQLLVLGGGENGTVYAASPTGFITQLQLNANGAELPVTVDDLPAAADALTRLTLGLASSAAAPTGETVVPNVLGFRLSSAVQVLAGASFTLAGTTSLASTSGVPPAVVVAQAPRAGSHVRRGTAVKLTVNSGPD